MLAVILAVWFAFFGTTLVHELAHAAVAFAVGARSVHVQVGLGPRLLHTGLIDIGLIPVWGNTHYSSRPPSKVISQGAQAGVAAAGPLANCIIGVVLASFRRLGKVAALNLGLGMLNFIPRPPFDGAIVFDYLFP